MTLRSDIQSPAYWAAQVHIDFCENLEIAEAEEFARSPLPSVFSFLRDLRVTVVGGPR